ncbi:DUF885 domain-containing protein [Cellulophaga sp. E16_2]|uniref:DUF885 domain-containing protein n=1 Tax=Cellulophaga algicola (strain DSM 14237 / IC166 / ACAM 630) TaxID=688270 RepID=E6X869_CELAD|nr:MULTISPECIES: DUF885 domain-containing protein [Cellulophaga]ADV49695.1 protein of unknown function DUF885 [Cellulophaga algicola DSM 14237]MBO0592150.1 DUF885 domain-containing protein [Cellulophaga sp. E16_2]
MKKILILSLCVFSLYSCKDEVKKEPAVAINNTEFDDVLDDYFEESLKLYPLNATSQGDTRYNDMLPNFLSDEFRTSENDFYSSYKKTLAEVDDKLLTSSQQMSKEILLWECDRNLERLGFREELLPINQMWTMQLMMGQLASGASSQPFKTVEDYDNWLKRLEDYTSWLASAKVRMEEGIKTGHVLPKSLVVKITPQLKDMTEPNLDNHLFFTPIKNMPDSFSDVDVDRLTEAYSAMISEKIIPAYQSIYDFMNTEYMAAARTTSGIEGIPNGKEYYDYSIKLYTTTDMTADEIHQLGLSEVARISSEMEKIKKEVGFEGDLKAFFDFVRNKKELMPFTSPEQVIENFKVIHEKMKPQVDKLFGNQPKTPFEVRRTEAFREASASAEYNPGSIDGTRPGIFYTPIPDVTKYNMYSDEDLFLHEAIPGHHFQISLTQENEELPKFRKTLWYSAYGEGWALYTESLGKELGLYTDPYQYFGMLGAEMHRAIRLVVDTGLHSKGWTREQAIQYSLANEAESEAGITSEIERYMANPGQALSYKIGQLKIMELRAKAEKELGDKFDIKAFHNQVLETGCVPLALLEKKITTWILNSK